MARRTAALLATATSTAAIRDVRLTSTPAGRYAQIAVIADDMANGSIDASADEFESAAHHVYLAPNAPRTPLCFSFWAAPTANS